MPLRLVPDSSLAAAWNDLGAEAVSRPGVRCSGTQGGCLFGSGVDKGENNDHSSQLKLHKAPLRCIVLRPFVHVFTYLNYIWQQFKGNCYKNTDPRVNPLALGIKAAVCTPTDGWDIPRSDLTPGAQTSVLGWRRKILKISLHTKLSESDRQVASCVNITWISYPDIDLEPPPLLSSRPSGRLVVYPCTELQWYLTGPALPSGEGDNVFKTFKSFNRMGKYFCGIFWIFCQ